MSDVPVYVLLARLAHQLETIRLHLQAGNMDACGPELDEAHRIVTQLQGSRR